MKVLSLRAPSARVNPGPQGLGLQPDALLGSIETHAQPEFAGLRHSLQLAIEQRKRRRSEHEAHARALPGLHRDALKCLQLAQRTRDARVVPGGPRIRR